MTKELFMAVWPQVEKAIYPIGGYDPEEHQRLRGEEAWKVLDRVRTFFSGGMDANMRVLERFRKLLGADRLEGVEPAIKRVIRERDTYQRAFKLSSKDGLELTRQVRTLCRAVDCDNTADALNAIEKLRECADLLERVVEAGTPLFFHKWPVNPNLDKDYLERLKTVAPFNKQDLGPAVSTIHSETFKCFEDAGLIRNCLEGKNNHFIFGRRLLIDDSFPPSHPLDWLALSGAGRPTPAEVDRLTVLASTRGLKKAFASNKPETVIRPMTSRSEAEQAARQSDYSNQPVNGGNVCESY